MRSDHRFIFICICIALMAALVYIVGESLQQASKPAYLQAADESGNAIPAEAGVFSRSTQALNYLDMPEQLPSSRTMKEYYDNRAYPGAPPAIPHPLINERSLGGKTCLQCHQNGGYVPRFKAFTPVVPHPQLINCRQCHVVTQ